MREREKLYGAGDPQLFNQLLLEVVQAVNTEIVSPEFLSETLQRIRDFFSFGSAWIYEADPNRSFILQEHSSTFQHDKLPESFVLEDIFTPEQIDYITENPFCCATKELRNSEIHDAVCAYFEVQSVFQVYVIDNVGTIVGSIGMTDKREHFPLDDIEFFQVNTLAKLFVERSRARIFKRRLEYTSTTLKNIMDHMGFDIYVNDFYTHEMLYANESMAAPYGGWEKMVGKTCYEALYEDQHEECDFCPKQHLIDDEGNPTKTYSWDYQRPFDGAWFRVICAAFKWTDGRLAQVISSADINDAKKNELLIQKMAYQDQLTGIPNRRKLEDDLKKLLDEPEKEPTGISVLFLDMDNFKYVNDTYGHNVGDALLKHVSKHFLENTLTADHCYRYGGDEFIFLYENTSREKGEALGEEIVKLLETPFDLEGEPFVPTASVGIAHYPEDGTGFWELLDKADDAMYKVKEQRKLAARAK